MADKMDLYTETCFGCSKVITQQYSTSFSRGIRAFDRRYRDAIYGIYGFVRYADEIVDTFHEHDKAALIAGFRKETFAAIEQGISLNPVLHSFQYVVNRYGLDTGLINAFLRSMEMDLDKTTFDTTEYKDYIYGSAEVVGLMCLHVFCGKDKALYQQLLPQARSLGAAFQKVNFLRDVKADMEDRGRTYFPNVDFNNFTHRDKQQIEADIKLDFDNALAGIRQLPKGTRLGVYVAYVYYRQLFKQIKQTEPATILQKRIRVSGTHKAALYFKALLKQKLNAI
jgi:phytoene/squalene synthetase